MKLLSYILSIILSDLSFSRIVIIEKKHKFDYDNQPGLG